MKVLKLLIFVQFLIIFNCKAQLFSIFSSDDKPKVRELLMDRAIQIESTKAINYMYNFKFHEAEVEFKWLMAKNPGHPIGPFLLGLNDWWKIVPDTGNEEFDKSIHKRMDETINLAEKMLDQHSKSKEAAFFLAAAYAFKGRVYAERENWMQAAWAGKLSLKYLDRSRGNVDINPELLFGDGLYNYYSKWIQENYKSLRPLLTFFKNGEKKRGIVQLEEVGLNAFYTRMEARYFLVQIYSMEGQNQKALNMARQMHSIYPDNSFFHRYLARCHFIGGDMEETQKYALELLENIKTRKYGYGPNDGRYAAYMMGYIQAHYYRNEEEARKYYEQCITFSKQNNSEDSGYSLSAALAVGDIAKKKGDLKTARQHYLQILDQKKNGSMYDDAKDRLKEIKKETKKVQRKARN